MDEQLLLVIFGGAMALVGQALMVWALLSDNRATVSIRSIFKKPKTNGLPASASGVLEKIVNEAWAKGVKK
jgi:predicted membrane-bound mannosyltransferase